MALGVTVHELSADELRELSRAISDGLRNAIEAVNGIIDRVCYYCRFLPPAVGDQVEPILKALAEATARIVLKIGEELLLGIAFPIVAFFLANMWVDDVKEPMKKVKGIVSDANLRVDDYWTGPAAEAYKSAVTAQSAAMEETATIADEVKERLWLAAGIIAGFYVALGVVIVQWVGVLTASAAATATGPGAVAGVPAAAADTAITAGAVVALILATGALVTGEVKIWTDLDGRVESSDKFPEGHWPKATAHAMSDGSLRDHDDTDWNMKAG